MDYQAALAALALPWRTGTKRGFPGAGQTIYAQLGPEPDPGRDPFIGVMFAPELAEDAVRAHNAAAEARRMSPAAPAGDTPRTCPDCNEPAPHKRGECPVF